MTIPAVCEDSGDFFIGKYPNSLFSPIYRRIKIIIHTFKVIVIIIPAVCEDSGDFLLENIPIHYFPLSIEG